MMLARFAADPSFEKNLSNHRHFSEMESIIIALVTRETMIGFYIVQLLDD